MGEALDLTELSAEEEQVSQNFAVQQAISHLNVHLGDELNSLYTTLNSKVVQVVLHSMEWKDSLRSRCNAWAFVSVGWEMDTLRVIFVEKTKRQATVSTGYFYVAEMWMNIWGLAECGVCNWAVGTNPQHRCPIFSRESFDSIPTSATFVDVIFSGCHRVWLPFHRVG